MRTIYLGGTFDIPHYGHIKFFETAKKIADYVVVSLNDDEFIKQYKGNYPVMPYGQRKVIIESCRFVDSVIVNVGGYNSKPAILQVKPDFILHGDDWTGDEYLAQLGLTQDWLDRHGITLLYTPYNKVTSTTHIKQLIKST